MSDHGILVVEEKSIVDSLDSEEVSQCELANVSFCSEVSSIGPKSSESFRTSRKISSISLDTDECESVNNEKVKGKQSDDDKRHWMIHGPSRANWDLDYQRILADRQNKLNNFILRQSKAANVKRHDHHIMLRILISEAYFRDPDRAKNRPLWKKIVAEIGKEYWGANAIFNLSPDPYHDVLAKLSSMMIWNNKARHWRYQYHDTELEARQARQLEILERLKLSGKLFL
ncbi:unnamed protein product [Phytomonas sp. EM1]|nr:unnamed protein product [Phytomonas sp. EM1]|eukprot:CCW61536.1 unnamed protein product [Phytomonas sp. isolate EM1]